MAPEFKTKKPEQTPAAWYPDPEQPGTLRWWDGKQWTDSRRNADEAGWQPQSVTGELKGTNGSITFDGEWITIHHGAFQGGGSALRGAQDLRFHVSQIAGVDLRGSAMTGCSLTVVLPGDRTPQRGVMRGVKDQNTVTFTSSKRKQVEEMKRTIEDALVAAHRSPATPVATQSNSPLEQLRLLGELRDNGVLTDEEFQAKKAEILGS